MIITLTFEKDDPITIVMVTSNVPDERYILSEREIIDFEIPKLFGIDFNVGSIITF